MLILLSASWTKDRWVWDQVLYSSSNKISNVWFILFYLFSCVSSASGTDIFMKVTLKFMQLIFINAFLFVDLQIKLRNKRHIRVLKVAFIKKHFLLKTKDKIHFTDFLDFIKMSFVLDYPFSFCLRVTWLSAHWADGCSCWESYRRLRIPGLEKPFDCSSSVFTTQLYSQRPTSFVGFRFRMPDVT